PRRAPKTPGQTFIDTMPEGTWAEVPNSHMASVGIQCYGLNCPECPDFWPQESSCSFNSVGLAGVMSVWSGGAFDTERNRLIIWGGGHAAYAGNEVYTFDTDTLLWERITNPSFNTGYDMDSCTFTSPATIEKPEGEVITHRSRVLERCAYYPNQQIDISSIPLEHRDYADYDTFGGGTIRCYGRLKGEYCSQQPYSGWIDYSQPASRHTNNYVAYVPGTIDSFYSFGGAAFYAGGQSGTNNIDAFDFDTRTWNKKLAILPTAGYAATAVDTTTNHVWTLGLASGRELWEYDPVADSMTLRYPQMDYGWHYYKVIVIDPVRKLLVAVGRGTYMVFDISSVDTNGYVTQIESVSSGPQDLVDSNYPTLDYDYTTGKMVGWLGGTDVYELDLDTHTWSKIPASITNTITPTNPTGNGVYGRWRYDPSKNVFIVVNEIDENVFVYKLSDAAPVQSCMPEDVNNDGTVGIGDLVEIARDFGGSSVSADVNNDNIVDLKDIVQVARKFGQIAACECIEGLSRPCGTNEGICEMGVESCLNGAWSGECLGGVNPQPEICDGLDNNCDTFTDEGCPVCECSDNLCENGNTGMICDGCNYVAAPIEICEDGVDNDCDGADAVCSVGTVA
ncbi:hypothetical protein GOV09_05670, partial [Candidatus Woesearchaeota archaeon]|nr:hypothetical protein [Candidatus Woesearchaeota archaeon]